MALSKAQFMEKPQFPRSTHKIDGMGELVLRELSVKEKMDIEKWAEPIKGQSKDEAGVFSVMALVAASICEPDGEPMFTRDELPTGVETVKGYGERAVKLLIDAYKQVNGGAEEPKEALGN